MSTNPVPMPAYANKLKLGRKEKNAIAAKAAGYLSRDKFRIPTILSTHIIN